MHGLTGADTPDGLSDALQGMIPQVRQALEQGEAAEAELKAQLDGQREYNTRLRRALNIFDPNYVHPNSSGAERFKKKKRNGTPSHVGVPRVNGTATGHGISMERAKVFADAIIQLIDGGQQFVTQKEVYTAAGGDQTQSSNAFRWFRKIGFIRKAGRDPETKRDRWAILDRDAVEKAIRETQVNA